MGVMSVDKPVPTTSVWRLDILPFHHHACGLLQLWSLGLQGMHFYLLSHFISLRYEHVAIYLDKISAAAILKQLRTVL